MVLIDLRLIGGLWCVSIGGFFSLNSKKIHAGSKKVIKNLVVYNKIATFVVSKDEKFFDFMKKSELERRLKSLGCYLASHGKKHDKWVNRKTGTFEYVPRHADEVATGTASKILKRLAGE